MFDLPFDLLHKEVLDLLASLAEMRLRHKLKKLPSNVPRYRERIERAIPELYATETFGELFFWWRQINTMLREAATAKENEFKHKKENM